MESKHSRQDEDHPVTAENLSPDRDQFQHAHSIYVRQRHQEPVRINADDESQCMLFIYAAAVILPIILFVLIAVFALPSATKTLNPKESLVGTNLQNCSTFLERASLTTNTLRCYSKSTFTVGTTNSLGIYVKLFSNLNQLMLFYVDLSPYAKQQANKNVRFNQNITFSIYTAEYSSQSKQTRIVGRLHQKNITVNRRISRLADNKYFLGYQSKIASGQQYFVEITFQNRSAITNSSAFYLNVETVRESFTIYTILLRVAFFIVCLVILALYTNRLLKVPKRKVSIEQRGVQIIGALTLLFNDQLYFVTVLWPNPVSSFLSALFIWSYLFGLYVLWTSFFLRIINEQPDTKTTELKRPLRIVLFVVFYLIGLTFCAGYAIIQSGEYPMISVNDIDYTWFRVYLAFLIFCLIWALLYLFYLFVTVCRKPLRAYRHSVFVYISLFYILVIVVMALLGSFGVYNFSGGLIFFTFAFANSYSYFLMYLYSPTRDQLLRYRQVDYELRASQSENLQEVKTVNIQLLQQGSVKFADQKLIDIDLQSSNNSEQTDKKSDQSIRRRKRRLSKHQKSHQPKNNMTDTHQRIMKEQQLHQTQKQHKDISIQEQHYGQDF